MNYRIKNVTTEEELDAVLTFAEKIFGKDDLGLVISAREEWVKRLFDHPELLLYAEANEEIITIVLGFIEDNGNMTIGVVATDKKWRNHGIAKELMLLLEERAKAFNVHLIALGSVGAAEGFYAKLGYTGQLLIQSTKHSIDELLTLNPGYPVAFINIYNGMINQVCLKLPQGDRALQKLYETTFDDCHTLSWSSYFVTVYSKDVLVNRRSYSTVCFTTSL